MALLAVFDVGCKGSVGGKGGAGGAGGAGANDPGSTGSGGGGGSASPPPPPFQAVTSPAAIRKVKNLLTGLAPTDDEVATVTAQGTAGLKALITTWTTGADFKDKFRDKMVFFFRNAFQ